MIKNKRNTFLGLAIIFLLLSIALEVYWQNRYDVDRVIEVFNDQLIKNQNELTNDVKEFSENLHFINTESGLFALFNQYKKSVEKGETGWLIYQNNTLKNWSDRALSFYGDLKQFKTLHGYISLPNGEYLIEFEEMEDITIVGLRLIKKNYNHQNIYLQNKFQNSYNLPYNYEIAIERNSDNLYPIVDNQGNNLFYINTSNDEVVSSQFPIIIAFTYLFSLIFFLMGFQILIKQIKFNLYIKYAITAIILFLIYWCHLYFNVPKPIYYLTLFKPTHFAYSQLLPSLGDYIIISIFIFFWIFSFSLSKKNITITKKSENYLRLAILLILYLIVYQLIIILLKNSTVSFTLNKIIEVDSYSILAITSVGLLLIGITLLTIRVFYNLKNQFNRKTLLIQIVISTLLLLLTHYLFYGSLKVSLPLFFLATAITSLFYQDILIRRYTLSYLVVFVTILSFFSLYIFYYSTAEKEREIQKLMAVNLVSEHDPTAELFLSDLQKEIDSDTVLINMIKNDEAIEKYIIESYFDGYFSKYNIDIFLCSVDDSLIVNPDNRMVPCKPFFMDMISNQGLQIENSDFYFMDNMNGRISYTGAIDLTLDDLERFLFIELNTDVQFEGIGFPELLIDQALIRPQKYKNFTYAKYYNGGLTDMQGDYNYNLNVYSYVDSSKEFTYKRWDNKEHLIYHTSKDNYVIVSRKIFTAIDYLISFPYLFVFYFFIVLTIIILEGSLIKRRRPKFNLKVKIQASIISVVFISLLIVAIGTIWYNVNEYEIKHRNDLDEKMKSIAKEIDMRLNNTPAITTLQLIWLHRELAKLSNVFRTDINIYSTDGNLLASSRPEIFEQGLISTRINAKAFYEIYHNYKINYSQPEKIGELSYLSAYRPIINNQGKYLGFINLPYFIKQDRYSQELSTIVVAFINLYVLLLLLSIIFAVFLSNQITRPLVLIQENLRKIELGKKAKHIQYNREDEIGSLVNEYNKKVDELAVSAGLLARSERESAWREMAKQIAHEIKNPLTPMKLNLQNLQRLDKTNEAYDEQLKKVTSILIEQIDNLSNIATEFSNFAKIPLAKKEVFNLSEKLKKIIDLYEMHSRVDIQFLPNGHVDINVYADKEQFSRAIINLIRNGIQAVPEDKVGCIKIAIDRKEDIAIISIQDNGKGIPETIKKKMFTPNFTTKSSGMGLGLAIVKSIVDNFNGDIYFETEENIGTTFFIEIPVHESTPDE